MPTFATVTAEHVQQAMRECDQVGDDAFLKRHGSGATRQSFLWHEGKAYDSKVILAVALRLATGRTTPSRDVGGDKARVAEVLTALEFDVVPDRDISDLPLAPAVGEWRDVADVGAEEAGEAWAEAARGVLLEVAARYHAMVTYKELAALAQVRTGIRTRQLVQHWVGDVLARVSRTCAGKDEPLLSSLCVNTSGSVGEGYAVVVAELRGEPVGDADDHAANERLECHRRFGAELPADGGRPALAPKLASARDRVRRVALRDAPASVCPSCNFAVPATGVCDNCG